jgi:predicted ATPase
MASSLSSENREAIGRRFGLLAPTCQEALLVGAAIGNEFTAETVSRVCKREVEQVREALEGDASGDLVSAVSGATGVYRFSDRRIRELLYREIPRARRPWLRRQIAENITR